MKKVSYVNILLLSTVLFSTGCAKKLLISTGAKSNEPLIFNNEYKIEDLGQIEVEGSAFWGIPSFKKNNKNNHKRGMLFTFNGVNITKTPRILPIVTLIAYSSLCQNIAQLALFGEDDIFDTDDYGKSLAAWVIGLPLAGTLNNLTWNNSAFSGASETFNYTLLNEYPNVDVFFYPKYDITKRNIFSEEGVNLKYLWFQDATLRGKINGATIIKKN